MPLPFKIVPKVLCSLCSLSLCAGLIAMGAGGARAHGLETVQAKVYDAGSEIVDAKTGASLSLELSGAVPYRIFTLTDPLRMVLDFSIVDWTGFNPIAFDQTEAVTSVRVGEFRDGWSRMVLDLSTPLAVQTSVLEATNDDQTAQGLTSYALNINLAHVSDMEFASQAGVPKAAQLFQVGEAAQMMALARHSIGTAPLRVVLDPGHGGIDPGAQRDGHREADLMLQFAHELRDVLLQSEDFEVILTRDDDTFVPLETRISIANSVVADVFISLHADAIAHGVAEGATVYTLSKEASDEASQKLAERHDRADLLAGVDLSDQDDVIADVLFDMARAETQPRTERLAGHIVRSFKANIGTYKRPHLEAGFSVLKSADIPSVLLEMGFLSSPSDREKLLDPQWRAQAALALRDALSAWVDGEVALSPVNLPEK